MSKQVYNEELKNRFIAESCQTSSMKALFRNVFELVAPEEERLGADICTWGEAPLREMLEKLAGFRGYSSKNRENLLKRYVSWCVNSGVPGASGAIFGVKVDGLSSVRQKTVSGPEHLQRCLDSFLAPESDVTADNVIRGYCWLSFSGMTDDEIIKVRTKDVDLEAFVVCSGERAFPLYKEAVPCIRVLREMSCFKYFHEGYENEFTWRVRPDGDKLLRGLRSPEPSLLGIRARLSDKSVKAFNAGAADVKVSAFRIWISGEFYRMYQKERMGEAVDFMPLARRGVEAKEKNGKPYKLESEANRRTVEGKTREIARNYLEDYNRWKLAYSV